MPTPDPQEFLVAAPDNEVDEEQPSKKPCLDSVPTEHASLDHESPRKKIRELNKREKKNNITKEEIESVSAGISTPE